MIENLNAALQFGKHSLSMSDTVIVTPDGHIHVGMRGNEERLKDEKNFIIKQNGIVTVPTAKIEEAEETKKAKK